MRLDKLGVVTRERQDNADVTVVTGAGAPSFTGVGIEARALWRAVKELGAGRGLSLKEIADYAFESGHYPGAADRLYDYARNNILTNAKRSNVVGLSWPDEGTPERPDPLASAAFHPAAAEPIKEMLSGVEAIVDGDKGEIGFYTRAAHDIFGNPAKFKALVQKGRKFSKYIPKAD